MTTVDLIIALLFGLGWLFIGLIVLQYRLKQVPERLVEIESIVGEEAAESYLQLFAPNLPADDSPVDRVRGLFLGQHSIRSYVGASALLLLVSGATLALGYLWVWGSLRADERLFDIPIVLVLAMAGAYVWCVTELLDRKVSRDMTPDDIYRISFRFLYAVPLGYAFSLLAGAGTVAGLFAFAATAFPLKQLRRLFRTQVLSRLEAQQAPATSAREARIGQTIHGAARESLTRLAEIRIYTCVDLAYTDPIVLMTRTGLPLRTVIDWMDQALLALYIDPQVHDLRKLGLRSALEASQLYEKECVDGEGEKSKRIIELAKLLGSTPGFVVWMLGQVAEDPHLEFMSLVWGEEEEEEEDDEEGEEGDA